VEAVLRLMDEYQIHYVPITRHGLLYGIINMLDLVKFRLAQIDAEARALKAYSRRSQLRNGVRCLWR
jgi:CBS domain-containing protein